MFITRIITVKRYKSHQNFCKYNNLFFSLNNFIIIIGIYEIH